MPERIGAEWTLWRLVLERLATFEALNSTAWSIDDVWDMNLVLDAWNRAGTPPPGK